MQQTITAFLTAGNYCANAFQKDVKKNYYQGQLTTCQLSLTLSLLRGPLAVFQVTKTNFLSFPCGRVGHGTEGFNGI